MPTSAEYMQFPPRLGLAVQSDLQLKMDKNKLTVNNPYRAPASDLTDEGNVSEEADESNPVNEWSEYAIKCAKRYRRSQAFGSVSAVWVFVLGKYSMDAIISFSDYGRFGIIKIILATSFLYLLFLSVDIVFSKLAIWYCSQTQTVKRYLNKQERSNRRWHNRPIVMTIFLMLGVLVGMIPVEFLIHDDVDWPSIRTLSLLALPLMMPIAYIPLRLGMRRSQLWLARLARGG